MDDILGKIDDKLESCKFIRKEHNIDHNFHEDTSLPPLFDGEERAPTDNSRNKNLYKVYPHNDGIFYDVPPSFEFPKKTNRLNGWNLWCVGQPAYIYKDKDNKSVQAPIRPFGKIRYNFLPKKLKNSYRTNWKPVFKLMQGND